MTNRELENKVYKELLPLYGHHESLSVRQVLFSALHGMPDHHWLLNRDREADPLLIRQIETALNQLLDFVPVQYVIGKVWFHGLELNVAPGVLIPRQETEELVSLIVQKHRYDKQIEVLDIGTGSGAIALSIASQIPRATITAIDFSDAAISIALANAGKLNIGIRILKADIFNEADCRQLHQFNVIVSNPPYVKESEKTMMQRNVLDYEPPEALFVPDVDPLLYYRTIIKFAVTHLKSSGELWFEINELEGSGIYDLLQSAGFSEIQIYKDIRGKERFITAVFHH